MNYVFVSFGILFLFCLVFLLGYSLGFKRISARYIQGASPRVKDRPAREAAIETEASSDFGTTMPNGRRLPAAGQAGGDRIATSPVVGSRQLSSQQQRQAAAPASAVEQPLAARSYPAGAARLATPASNQVHQQSAAPTAAPVARKGRGQG